MKGRLIRPFAFSHGGKNIMHKLCDMHTHTAFSPDAKSSPEEMCEQAARLGLAAYAITDHCDCNFWLPTDDKSLVDFEMYGSRDYSHASISAIDSLKEKYHGRLNLICGIELGQPLQNITAAEEILSNKKLDFIIGSHHQNAGMSDFYWIKYKKMDLSEIYSLLDDYFSQMLEICRWGGFDVLGHLTYPLRYICGDCGINIDLSRYDDIIREIFCTLVDKGKGIEINTSGLRQSYGMTFPTLKYVKLFRQLGGEIVTLGSDAHSAADIGKGLDEGAEIAATAGFKYTAFFSKRQPQFIPI
jgi:histidinol-phosphatase (PHP family)